MLSSVPGSSNFVLSAARRLLSAALPLAAAAAFAAPAAAPLLPAKVDAFIENRCADCHDSDEKKGGLDLTALKFTPDDSRNFAAWVKVYDRVLADEMPPKKKPR